MKKAAAIVLVALGAALSIGAHRTVTDHPPHAAPPVAEVPQEGPAPAAASGADYPGDVVAWLTESAKADWIKGVADAEAALAEARRRAQTATARAGGGTGDCAGSWSIPVAYVWRESRCSYTVWNSGGSGAWGAYQIIPSTWYGTCADLGQHGSASPAAQDECASRLWNGGAGASHWGG